MNVWSRRLARSCPLREWELRKLHSLKLSDGESISRLCARCRAIMVELASLGGALQKSR
jgi:hypothetical protein